MEDRASIGQLESFDLERSTLPHDFRHKKARDNLPRSPDWEHSLATHRSGANLRTNTPDGKPGDSDCGVRQRFGLRLFRVVWVAGLRPFRNGAMAKAAS